MSKLQRVIAVAALAIFGIAATSYPPYPGPRNSSAVFLVGSGDTTYPPLPGPRNSSPVFTVNPTTGLPNPAAVSLCCSPTVTPTGNGADTTQDVLQTFTVAANTLVNVGDRIQFVAGGNFISSTDTKTVRVQWGAGAVVGTLVESVTAQQLWRVQGEIIKTGSSTQTVSLMFATNSNSTSANYILTTRPDGTTNAFQITGQNSTNSVANSILCGYFTLDYVPYSM